MNITLENMLSEKYIPDFFFRLFPSKIKGDLLLAKFGEGSLCLYIFDQPDQPVKKWGIWGKDYNVISVELDITLIKADIVNPQNMKKGPIDIQYLSADFCRRRRYSLHSKGDDWNVYLEVVYGRYCPSIAHATYRE